MRDTSRKIDTASIDEDGFGGVAVYDGQQLLGEMFERGCRVAAQLADGTDLGTYPNRPAASAAILGAARRP
jgi:hypothetical protein